MNLDSMLSLLTMLVGVAVAILLAGIPWAYGIHGRLTRIESCLSEQLRGEQQRLVELDKRLSRLERAAGRSREATAS